MKIRYMQDTADDGDRDYVRGSGGVGLRQPLPSIVIDEGQIIVHGAFMG